MNTLFTIEPTPRPALDLARERLAKARQALADEDPAVWNEFMHSDVLAATEELTRLEREAIEKSRP